MKIKRNGLRKDESGHPQPPRIRPKQIWLLDGKPAPTKCKGAYPIHSERVFTQK